MTTTAKMTCDKCGAVVAARGIVSHQEGKQCKARTFIRRMEARGWIVPRVDAREYGVPGEHGPYTYAGRHRDGDRFQYGVWHPRWVSDIYAVTSALTPWERRDIWTECMRDPAWRDAIIATACVGGNDAAAILVHERLMERRKAHGG